VNSASVSARPTGPRTRSPSRSPCLQVPHDVHPSHRVYHSDEVLSQAHACRDRASHDLWSAHIPGVRLLPDLLLPIAAQRYGTAAPPTPHVHSSVSPEFAYPALSHAMAYPCRPSNAVLALTRSAMMLLLVHNDHFLAASELGEPASRPPPLADSMRNIGVLDPAGVSTMLVAQGLQSTSPFQTRPGPLVRCARFLDIDSQ
jgi:hypothetical protein